MLAAQPALAPLRARAARRSARSPLLCSASALKTMEVTGRKVEVYSDAAAASAAVVDAFVAAYHEVLHRHEAAIGMRAPRSRADSTACTSC